MKYLGTSLFLVPKRFCEEKKGGERRMKNYS
jgi:hypothetical protein